MKKLSNEEQLHRAGLFFCALARPWIEIAEGIRSGTIPWNACLSLCIVLQLGLQFGVDRALLAGTPLIWFHSTPDRYLFYYFLIAAIPFVGWGIVQAGRKRQLTTRLTKVFDACGLKNKLGKFPNFIFDRPIDSSTRKLRLTRAVLDLHDFEKAKGALEGGLQVYIDEFREHRERGTVDVIYSPYPMPDKYVFGPPERLKRATFLIGTTRSQEITASLDSVPHLLVAGQTGGGKSTFLRQFITTQFLNDTKAEFLLVDLKGGMEFQIFEKLPRVTVPQSTKTAIHKIETLSEALDERMKFLKSLRCKDIQEFFEKKKQQTLPSNIKAIRLNRHFVVIDEAAEMFLAGHHASGQDVQKAKRALSKVARQGRAVGFHLIVATQRPDSRALDPQIKANLPGALCFQMANDISSITVIGNGRATDLPAIPGRAIWKVSKDMLEVQTPYLSTEEADGLLQPFRDETLELINEEKQLPSLSDSRSKESNSRERLRNG